MKQPLILIAEDETALATLLTYNLGAAGFDCRWVGDGEAARIALREEQPDLIVLDWMLPKLSGIELCRQIRLDRNLKTVPILMLTARADEADKLRGLDVGADDYMTKPFSMPELIARLRALLRRSGLSLEDKLQFADLELDRVAHRAHRAGQILPLGPTEYRLLEYFMTHPRRVLSREQLLDAVWGYDQDIEIRTVDVHIRRLRKSLNQLGQPDLIRTVRAAGYALDDAPGF